MERLEHILQQGVATETAQKEAVAVTKERTSLSPPSPTSSFKGTTVSSNSSGARALVPVQQLQGLFTKGTGSSDHIPVLSSPPASLKGKDLLFEAQELLPASRAMQYIL